MGNSREENSRKEDANNEQIIKITKQDWISKVAKEDADKEEVVKPGVQQGMDGIRSEEAAQDIETPSKRKSLLALIVENAKENKVDVLRSKSPDVNTESRYQQCETENVHFENAVRSNSNNRLVKGEKNKGIIPPRRSFLGK